MIHISTLKQRVVICFSMNLFQEKMNGDAGFSKNGN